MQLLLLIHIRHFISVIAHRVTRSEEGASMVEYGLLLALIAVVCLGAVSMVGTSARGQFSKISDAINF